MRFSIVNHVRKSTLREPPLFRIALTPAELSTTGPGHRAVRSCVAGVPNPAHTLRRWMEVAKGTRNAQVRIEDLGNYRSHGLFLSLRQWLGSAMCTCSQKTHVLLVWYKLDLSLGDVSWFFYDAFRFKFQHHGAPWSITMHCNAAIIYEVSVHSKKIWTCQWESDFPQMTATEETTKCLCKAMSFRRRHLKVTCHSCLSHLTDIILERIEWGAGTQTGNYFAYCWDGDEFSLHGFIGGSKI